MQAIPVQKSGFGTGNRRPLLFDGWIMRQDIAIKEILRLEDEARFFSECGISKLEPFGKDFYMTFSPQIQRELFFFFIFFFIFIKS